LTFENIGAYLFKQTFDC